MWAFPGKTSTVIVMFSKGVYDPPNVRDPGFHRISPSTGLGSPGKALSWSWA